MGITIVAIGSLASVLLASHSTLPPAVSLAVLFGLLFASHFLGDMFADANFKSCRLIAALVSATIGATVFALAPRYRMPLLPRNPLAYKIVSVTVAVGVWNVINMYILGNSCN